LSLIKVVILYDVVKVKIEGVETAVRGGCKTSRCASGEKRESGRKDAQTRGHQEVRAEKGGL
jgi:hypothetical protein